MRSFISMSSINRIMASCRSAQREQERMSLISSQNGMKKEFPPTFTVKKVEFNSQSRVAKIEILQSQQYRTIDRYVTQDYVRYPIFSDWKTREKTIKKSIKLTNSVLEKLDHNEDPLIRQLAVDIVFGLKREDLFPSWFVIHFLHKEWDEAIHSVLETENKFVGEKRKEIDEWTALISDTENSIQEQLRILKKLYAKEWRIDKKISKIESAKPSVLLSIVTCGIRNYLFSNRRRRRLSLKQSALEKKIFSADATIKRLNADIITIDGKIRKNEVDISDKQKETQKSIRVFAEQYSRKIKAVAPLPVVVETGSGFILLKTILGMEYEKIIGCYIIRNRENTRCYVGQSKDVLKRLRQHFHGTVPSNIIFAEDFYSSQWTDKEDLFEVKIIPCSTKDELDETERELIEEYEAFSKGYNGTNGNQ